MSLDKKIEEFNNLFKGLSTEALKIKYKKLSAEIVEYQLKNNQFAGTQLQDLYDKVQSIRKQSSENQYYFITICPYEDLELSKLIKTMEKVLKKKWFNKYLYVYEQRQHENDKPFYGIHTHIIVPKGNIKKSDAIREIFNTCKNIVGSQQSIDVKLLQTEVDLKTRINYILGTKSTQEKQQKQKIDKIFREQNNLLSYYSLGEWEDIIHMSLTNAL